MSKENKGYIGREYKSLRGTGKNSDKVMDDSEICSKDALEVF